MNEPRRIDYEDGHWHLDKKVPLSLIGVAVVQFAMIVAGWASMSEIVKDHERRLAREEAQHTAERLVVVETAIKQQELRDGRQDAATSESLSLVREELRSINTKLDRFFFSITPQKEGPRK